MIEISTYTYLSALLFSIGVFVVLTKKNFIFILMGIELMFNAANINLVAFGHRYDGFGGNLYALFVILIAACESAVALAIILHVYKFYKTANPDEVSKLKNE